MSDMDCIRSRVALAARQTSMAFASVWSEIWRFAVAPSNAVPKNCNIGAQLQSLKCIDPKLFLENLLPPKNAVLNLALSWAPSDTIDKNRNIGAQLQSILHTMAQKIFWKIYFL